MSKTIIIAEKPSVAQDIVRALTPVSGKFEKHAEHFENDQYVVTSAVGHLVEIKAPEEFDVKRGKWSFANLPVVPPHFDLAPIDKAKTRLNAVVKLVKRKDVTAMINACDAGREGELIFRLIVQYAGAGQDADEQADPAPVAAEHDAAGHPRRLRAAAQRRADAAAWPTPRAAAREADWLVGINGTRAMTAFNSRDGGFFLTTVGRVQTPTLSHRGRARGEDPQARGARLLGDQGHLRRPGRAVRGQVVRPGVEEERRRRAPRRPAVETPKRAGHRRRRARPAGHRDRGGQAQHPEQPAAVRPDDAAARGQLALRLLGQDHAVASRRRCTRSTRC